MGRLNENRGPGRFLLTDPVFDAIDRGFKLLKIERPPELDAWGAELTFADVMR